MTIGERIKQRRIELGLSQEDLAKRLGNKSRASVCTVEKDKEDLTTDRIRKYAEALETTPAYLMGWEDNENISRDHIKEIASLFREKFSKYSPEEVEKAMKIIELYENATPEGRAAFETLLKLSQQNP